MNQAVTSRGGRGAAKIQFAALTTILAIAAALTGAVCARDATAQANRYATGARQQTQEIRPAPQKEIISGEVDQYIAQQMHAQRIPGLSLAVALDGRVIKAKGYGYADLEFRAPVTTDTFFESGSIGKQFTATAVMMLVEEGKIGLEDKITKYFPDAPASWNDITIRELLSHEAGLKNYTGVGDIDFRKDYTEDQLLKIAESFPLDFPPGSDWSYSNTGYVVLGILIHKVTGEFYGDFLHQRIFAPLGMKTRVISESDIIPNRASGYKLVKGQWKNQDWVSPSLNTTADGSLYFTALDLTKWDAALYTTQLLKQSSLDQMWTVQKYQTGPNAGKPNKGNYGFGWFINTMNGHKLIEHGGSWQGFTDTICRYVDDKLTVIVLTNLDSEHSNPDKIAHQVAGFYIPALKPPPPPKPIADTEPQVTAQLRDVVERLATGSLDLSQFTPDAQKKFGADMQKAAQDFLANEGALGKLELLSRTEENGVRTYKYRAHFEYGTTITLTLRLTGDGKIDGLAFGE
ncbi:MAG TPA: serine hydrolase domain-containing protein [Candidatus Acidoferrales bacterium]|nr:serine hydrolase domain-containing protein [Candidatus Acidoferrales bacterium]